MREVCIVGSQLRMKTKCSGSVVIRDALSQVPENSTMSAGLESVLHRQSGGFHSLHTGGF